MTISEKIKKNANKQEDIVKNVMQFLDLQVMAENVHSLLEICCM